LTIVKSDKVLKCLSVTLISMLLVGVCAAGTILSVKAPVTEPIDMWLVTTTNEAFGYYGGYFPIIPLLQTEFAKIGITLRHHPMEQGRWWDHIWENKWNVSGDGDGDPTTYDETYDGWDFFFEEWWLNPNSYIWLDELVYSWNTIDVGGWNVMSWTDYKSDNLYQRGMTTQSPTTHKNLIWRWQEEFMHNPPAIPMFYFKLYTARGAYVEDWDDTAWLYEMSQLYINKTKFDLVAPSSRKEIGSDTIIWGAVEPIYTWYPLGTLTYTEESVNVLTNGLLYYISREDLTFPNSGEYITKPGLASADPTWMQITDPKQGGQTVWVARVPLRTGLTWTDGVPFNASDVAFSYNAILNPKAHSLARGDYWFLLDRVDIVDAYTVDFVHKPKFGPDYDFTGYQSHGWARGMLPWHKLKNLDPTKYVDQYTDIVPATEPGGTGLPVLGPYIPTHWDDATDTLEFRKRPEYETALGWSGKLPTNFLLKTIEDDFERKNALLNLAVDFCEYPIAQDTWWQGIPNGTETAAHRVYTYNYPASHPLWMNLRNPILSNRYVRLAIAHAIPYDTIISSVLPGWGIAQGWPGKTFILPWQEGFNTELPPYHYDIDEAKMYMDMWRYSQAEKQPYTNGPVGDSDFSGHVDIGDFAVWAEWFGASEPDWAHKQWGGNNIDPDNNNDNATDLEDFDPCWRTNIDKYYPFKGAL